MLNLLSQTCQTHFQGGLPDLSMRFIGESLRPAEAADPKCQLRLNSILKLVETMANQHFANNSSNVAQLDPIGSAAYDINIPGSDYDYVLRFEKSSVLEYHGDWKGHGMGTSNKKGISQNRGICQIAWNWGTEILRPLILKHPNVNAKISNKLMVLHLRMGNLIQGSSDQERVDDILFF